VTHRDGSISANGQRGAVLAVSLVMLVVLTLLGVSVMNITQLEERMASNNQEVAQAFQIAETGLSQGYADDDAWNPATSAAQPSITITNANRTDQTSYAVEYIATTSPPTGYDVTQFQRVHFDFRSTATTQSGFSAQLHGGGSQVFRQTGITE
jgi:Tfp pilus assembly protein PilX